MLASKDRKHVRIEPFANSEEIHEDFQEEFQNDFQEKFQEDRYKNGRIEESSGEEGSGDNESREDDIEAVCDDVYGEGEKDKNQDLIHGSLTRPKFAFQPGTSWVKIATPSAPHQFLGVTHGGKLCLVDGLGKVVGKGPWETGSKPGSKSGSKSCSKSGSTPELEAGLGRREVGQGVFLNPPFRPSFVTEPIAISDWLLCRDCNSFVGSPSGISRNLSRLPLKFRDSARFLTYVPQGSLNPASTAGCGEGWAALDGDQFDFADRSVVQDKVGLYWHSQKTNKSESKSRSEPTSQTHTNSRLTGLTEFLSDSEDDTALALDLDSEPADNEAENEAAIDGETEHEKRFSDSSNEGTKNGLKNGLKNGSKGRFFLLDAAKPSNNFIVEPLMAMQLISSKGRRLTWYADGSLAMRSDPTLEDDQSMFWTLLPASISSAHSANGASFLQAPSLLSWQPHLSTDPLLPSTLEIGDLRLLSHPSDPHSRLENEPCLTNRSSAKGNPAYLQSQSQNEFPIQAQYFGDSAIPEKLHLFLQQKANDFGLIEKILVDDILLLILGVFRGSLLHTTIDFCNTFSAAETGYADRADLPTTTAAFGSQRCFGSVSGGEGSYRLPRLRTQVRFSEKRKRDPYLACDGASSEILFAEDDGSLIDESLRVMSGKCLKIVEQFFQARFFAQWLCQPPVTQTEDAFGRRLIAILDGLVSVSALVDAFAAVGRSPGEASFSGSMPNEPDRSVAGSELVVLLDRETTTAGKFGTSLPSGNSGNSVSLQNLHVFLSTAKPQLHFILHVARSHYETGSPYAAPTQTVSFWNANERALSLLDILLNALERSSTDSHDRALGRDLLIAASRPFLSILKSLFTAGSLHDPCREFFLESNAQKLSAYVDPPSSRGLCARPFISPRWKAKPPVSGLKSGSSLRIVSTRVPEFLREKVRARQDNQARQAHEENGEGGSRALSDIVLETAGLAGALAALSNDHSERCPLTGFTVNAGRVDGETGNVSSHGSQAGSIVRECRRYAKGVSDRFKRFVEALDAATATHTYTHTYTHASPHPMSSQTSIELGNEQRLPRSSAASSPDHVFYFTRGLKAIVIDTCNAASTTILSILVDHFFLPRTMRELFAGFAASAATIHGPVLLRLGGRSNVATASSIQPQYLHKCYREALRSSSLRKFDSLAIFTSMVTRRQTIESDLEAAVAKGESVLASENGEEEGEEEGEARGGRDRDFCLSSPKFMDSLALAFVNLPGILGLVYTPQIQQRYNAIFRFLFLLNATKIRLEAATQESLLLSKVLFSSALLQNSLNGQRQMLDSLNAILFHFAHAVLRPAEKRCDMICSAIGSAITGKETQTQIQIRSIQALHAAHTSLLSDLTNELFFPYPSLVTPFLAFLRSVDAYSSFCAQLHILANMGIHLHESIGLSESEGFNGSAGLNGAELDTVSKLQDHDLMLSKAHQAWTASLEALRTLSTGDDPRAVYFLRLSEFLDVYRFKDMNVVD